MKNWYYAFFTRTYEGKTTGAIYFVFYIIYYMIFSVLKYGFTNHYIDFVTIIQMRILFRDKTNFMNTSYGLNETWFVRKFF